MNGVTPRESNMQIFESDNASNRTAGTTFYATTIISNNHWILSWITVGTKVHVFYDTIVDQSTNSVVTRRA